MIWKNSTFLLQLFEQLIFWFLKFSLSFLYCRVEKRRGFSRKRADKNTDIDFINDRNMRFNRKIERFYGKYTTEIKQNLERGTAI